MSERRRTQRKLTTKTVTMDRTINKCIIVPSRVQKNEKSGLGFSTENCVKSAQGENQQKKSPRGNTIPDLDGRFTMLKKLLIDLFNNACHYAQLSPRIQRAFELHPANRPFEHRLRAV